MRPVVRRLGQLCHPLARAVQWSGVAGLNVLCWHRVDEAPGPLSVSPAEFAEQLDALEHWGARVLPLDEAWQRVRAGTLPPRAVALTFDDGYRSTATQAWPALVARGWPATCFVVPGYFGNPVGFPWDVTLRQPAAVLDAAEVQRLHADGLRIGSHTLSHRWLPRLDDADLDAELRGSRHLLQDMLGSVVTSLAYPAGHHDARVRRAVRAAGYVTAYSTRRGRSSTRTATYEVRRTVVPRRADDLVRVLDGAFDVLRPLDAARERRLLRDVAAHPDPSAHVGPGPSWAPPEGGGAPG